MDASSRQLLTLRELMAEVPSLVRALGGLNAGSPHCGTTSDPGDSTAWHSPPPVKGIPQRVGRILIGLGYIEVQRTEAHVCSSDELVLTGEGRAFLRSVLSALRATQPQPGSSRPSWNAAHRELSFGGVIMKRFTRTARNQMRLLTAFETFGWPDEIDDPLPRTDGILPSERIWQTVKQLNRTLSPRLVQFGTEAGGRRVLWRNSA